MNIVYLILKLFETKSGAGLPGLLWCSPYLRARLFRSAQYPPLGSANYEQRTVACPVLLYTCGSLWDNQLRCSGLSTQPAHRHARISIVMSSSMHSPRGYVLPIKAPSSLYSLPRSGWAFTPCVAIPQAARDQGPNRCTWLGA